VDKLVAIVGETASGKSGLALAIAERWNGEVVCADSRTVYTGMDIGTAKPTAEERARVPHHLLDVVAPGRTFTAADFQRLAGAAIRDIQARGKLPILVGGTGLYVDAVLYDFQFRPPADPGLRAELEKLTVPQLQQKIREQNLPMPRNEQNPRHLIRVLETGGQIGERSTLRPNTLLIGLSLPRDVLERRVSQRVDDMAAHGFTEEVQRLADSYGWDTEALQAPGYKAFRAYLQGRATLDEAKAAFIRNDLQLAKRQRTWFKRNLDIQWCNNPNEAIERVKDFLPSSRHPGLRAGIQ
jgi:tRNA dimethylallyltransferase